MFNTSKIQGEHAKENDEIIGGKHGENYIHNHEIAH